MTFVDELYQAYKDQLSSQEVDAELLTASVLDELGREDVLDLLKELKDEDLFGLFGLYLIENLKRRIHKDQLNGRPFYPDYTPRTIH
ncbi:DUF6154 family protein [Priestia abyssalis]|uniref:DUF6154 family protein n=1 Tax=Priestia abyssalis TaxID=1221450 RepID=UPI0009956859|nr:DUF6154 family protein [Priestia abyssalis]